MAIILKMPNRREGVRSESRFGARFRLAVAFILGLAVGGGAVKIISGGSAKLEESAGIEEPNTKVETGGDAVGEVGQTREVISQVTGGPLSAEEEEMLKVCAPIMERKEAERLGRLADQIIDQACISDEGEGRAIRAAVMEGYIKISRHIPIMDQKLILDDEKGCTKSVRMRKGPACGALYLESLRDDNRYQEVVESYDPEELLEQARKAGFEATMKGLYSRIRNLKRGLAQTANQAERDKLICEYWNSPHEPSLAIIRVDVRNKKAYRWAEDKFDESSLSAFNRSLLDMLSDESFKACFGRERKK